MLRKLSVLLVSLCVLLISCKKNEDVTYYTLSGLWEKSYYHEVAIQSLDTVTVNVSFEEYLFFSGYVDFVEYSYSESYKNYFIKGTYEKINDALQFNYETGSSVMYPYRMDKDKLLIETSRNATTKFITEYQRAL